MSDNTPTVPQARPVYLDLRGKPATEPTTLRDSHEETLWHNPTDSQVVLNLFMGVPSHGRPPSNYEEKTGLRRYVWQPNETKALPRELDQGVQETQCVEPECGQRTRACRDPEHQHRIVGGLGPQLINKGMQKRPMLSPALDDELARLKEAELREFEAWKLRRMADEQIAIAKAQSESVEHKHEPKKK